jgi:hypothetical protein
MGNDGKTSAMDETGGEEVRRGGCSFKCTNTCAFEYTEPSTNTNMKMLSPT